MSSAGGGATTRARLLAALLLGSGLLLLGGCAAAPPASADPDEVVEVTRWWSTPENAVGSSIDAEDPEQGARGLVPDEEAYCAVLRETGAGDETLLPEGVTAESPSYRAALRAYFAELAALAPGELADDWRLLGSAVLTLAELDEVAGPSPSTEAVDPAAVQEATRSIGEHAETACGLSAGAL